MKGDFDLLAYGV
uniref:Uncharacterized protein n=1 Tax=Anguilla anguilla TaxID=7936 RepID=A0A0E9XKS6_ANGAN